MGEERENPENPGIIQGIRDEKGRFVEGSSGNLAGKPKGVRNFTTKVREALMVIAEGKTATYEELFLKAILKKAIVEQDTVIMKLLWNYLDGMPNQSLNVNTKEDFADVKNMFNELEKKINERADNTNTDGGENPPDGKAETPEDIAK